MRLCLLSHWGLLWTGNGDLFLFDYNSKLVTAVLVLVISWSVLLWLSALIIWILVVVITILVVVFILMLLLGMWSSNRVSTFISGGLAIIIPLLVVSLGVPWLILVIRLLLVRLVASTLVGIS